jgi:hypothetical protein
VSGTNLLQIQRDNDNDVEELLNSIINENNNAGGMDNIDFN